MGVDSDKSVAVWRSCSGEWFDAELQVEIMTMSESNRAFTVDTVILNYWFKIYTAPKQRYYCTPSEIAAA